jgi:hypothetical protein
MITISDKLTDACTKYYSPTEHPAIDEITMLSFFNKTYQRNTKFGTKVYKLCDSKGYTQNLSAYLGNERKCVTATMRKGHATVSELSMRIGNLGHKLYTDNFFIPIYLMITYKGHKL